MLKNHPNAAANALRVSIQSANYRPSSDVITLTREKFPAVISFAANVKWKINLAALLEGEWLREQQTGTTC